MLYSTPARLNEISLFCVCVFEYKQILIHHIASNTSKTVPLPLPKPSIPLTAKRRDEQLLHPPRINFHPSQLRLWFAVDTTALYFRVDGKTAAERASQSIATSNEDTSGDIKSTGTDTDSTDRGRHRGLRAFGAIDLKTYNISIPQRTTPPVWLLGTGGANNSFAEGGAGAVVLNEDDEHGLDDDELDETERNMPATAFNINHEPRRFVVAIDRVAPVVDSNTFVVKLTDRWSGAAIRIVVPRPAGGELDRVSCWIVD